MSNPEQQLRLRDREMVPLALVRAMFALMALSVAGVAYVQFAGVPNTGVLVEDTVVAERSVQLVAQGRHGDYAVIDPSTEEPCAIITLGAEADTNAAVAADKVKAKKANTMASPI